MINKKKVGARFKSPTPTAAVGIGVTFDGCTSAEPFILHRCKYTTKIDNVIQSRVKK